MTDHRHYYAPSPGTGTPPGGQPPTMIGSPQVSPATPSGQWPQDLAGPLMAGPGRRGVARWVVVLAVVTAVLSVASFTTVLLWPAGDGGDGPPPAEPLAFHPFEAVGRVEFDQPSRTVFTEMLPDRVYTAWEQGGDLQVVAAGVADGAELWRRRISGSPRWGELFSIPGGVVAVGADDGGAARMYILDAGGGAELWQRDVSPEDWVSATGSHLIWYHEPDGLLRGVDIATGQDRWSQPVGQSATTVWALTDSDIDRPTDIEGYIGVTSSDPRLVMVDDDQSAQVIDGGTGTVVSQADNIARPRDNVVAYQGRLFVAADEAGFQVVSYDLDDLGGLPQTHYRAAGERYPEALEVCGRGRVCVLETESFDRETTELAVLDVAQGGNQLWRQPVPGAESVTSVGPWLLVVASNNPLLGFDDTGQEVVNRPGVMARLNSANLLVFAEDLRSSEQDLSVAGITVDADRPVELGPLTGVIGEQCSWNPRYLACPDRDGTTIWRFAEA